MRFLAVRAPRRDIQPGNHGGIPLRKRVDPENWDVRLCFPNSRRVWQKTVKPVWNYEWRRDVTRLPGGGAFRGGEKKHKKKKAPGTASFITRVKGQVFIIVRKGPVENWPRVSQVIYLWTTSHALHGDPPDEGCDRRVSCYGVIILLKHRIFLSLVQSFAVSASLKST